MEKRIILSIEGMHCASCVAAVEKAMGRLGGVKKAVVNLNAENVTVDYDSDKVSLPEFIDKIREVEDRRRKRDGRTHTFCKSGRIPGKNN